MSEMLKLDGQEKYYLIKRSELDAAREHLKRIVLYSTELTSETLTILLDRSISVLNSVQIGEENREITEEQATNLLAANDSNEDTT